MDEIVEITDNSEDTEKRRKILIKLLQRYGTPIFDEFSTDKSKEKAWNKILTKMNQEGYNYGKQTIKELANEYVQKCNCYNTSLKTCKPTDKPEDAYLAINDVAVIQHATSNFIHVNAGNHAELTGVGFEQTTDLTGMSGCSCF